MENLIKDTESTLGFLFHSARRTPQDKLTWSPMNQGRSTLNQLQECANTPDMYLMYLDPSHVPNSNSYEEATALQSTWTTIDACEQVAKENTTKLIAAIRKLKPEQMDDIHTMPWGMEMTTRDIAGLHNWNMIYHLGQINYIQTLWGDKEMM